MLGEKKFVYRFYFLGQKKLVRNQIRNSTASLKEMRAGLSLRSCSWSIHFIHLSSRIFFGFL
jgi:hypothetical protein